MQGPPVCLIVRLTARSNAQRRGQEESTASGPPVCLYVRLTARSKDVCTADLPICKTDCTARMHSPMLNVFLNISAK